MQLCSPKSHYATASRSSPARRWIASGTHDNFIRLPFGFPDVVLDELVARLRRAWTELRRHGPAPAAGRPVVRERCIVNAPIHPMTSTLKASTPAATLNSSSAIT